MIFLQYVLLPLIFAGAVWAQHHSGGDSWPDMTQVRQMVELKWEPVGRNLKVMVVGYEAAKVKYDDLQIEASIGFGENEKTLVVDRKKDHFIVNVNKNGNVDNLKLKLKVGDEEAKDYDVKLK